MVTAGDGAGSSSLMDPTPTIPNSSSRRDGEAGSRQQHLDIGKLICGLFEFQSGIGLLICGRFEFQSGISLISGVFQSSLPPTLFSIVAFR
ncbi:unnamed protein product [Urochloa humidicola]